MTVTNTDISELAIVMTTGHSPAGHEIEREVWLCIDHSGESRDQKWGYRLCVLRWPVVLRLANYSFFLSPSALLCSSYLKIEKKKRKKKMKKLYTTVFVRLKQPSRCSRSRPFCRLPPETDNSTSLSNSITLVNSPHEFFLKIGPLHDQTHLLVLDSTFLSLVTANITGFGLGLTYLCVFSLR